MRNLLALIAAALIAFVGVGWYLGWYQVQSTPSADGHSHINVDVNTKKIRQDVSKGVSEGKEKVEEFINQEKGGTQGDGKGSSWQVNISSNPNSQR